MLFDDGERRSVRGEMMGYLCLSMAGGSKQLLLRLHTFDSAVGRIRSPKDRSLPFMPVAPGPVNSCED